MRMEMFPINIQMIEGPPPREGENIQILGFNEEAFFSPNQGVPAGLPRGLVVKIHDRLFIKTGSDYYVPLSYIALARRIESDGR